MDYHILGPLEAFADGRPLRLTAFKQRALLTALLIEANTVVEVDRLIEALWPDRLPEDALGGLQVLVSQLRRVLEPERPVGAVNTVLLTRSGGYELRVEADALDAWRFEHLARRGRSALEAGELGAAREGLERALAILRGPALAGVEDLPFAQAEARRLEEARLAALVDLGEVRLHLGDHAALVGDLHSSIARDPWQEAFRAQLMLALYRCGRQAEALGAYRAARDAMIDELGIEPSPAVDDPRLFRVKPESQLSLQHRAGARQRPLRFLS